MTNKILFFTTRQLCYHSAGFFAAQLADALENAGYQCELCEIPEDGIAGVNAFTVDKNQGVAAVQTTNTYALTVIPFVRQLYARHFFEDILQILYRFSLQVFLGNDADTGGASLRFCSTEDAVTTIVSPSSSDR